MPKLILDLDALTVDSFDTAPAAAPPGTVLGHDDGRGEAGPLGSVKTPPDCSPVDSCLTRVCTFNDITCVGDDTCLPACPAK